MSGVLHHNKPNEGTLIPWKLIHSRRDNDMSTKPLTKSCNEVGVAQKQSVI